MNEYTRRDICDINVSLSICLANGNITVEFTGKQYGGSSRVVVPYSPDEHPEFNERVGNEIYWWVNEWFDKLAAAENIVEQTETFQGLKSGKFITIEKYGEDDYSAWWHDHESGDSETDGYSVRGTKQDIIDEIDEEV